MQKQKEAADILFILFQKLSFRRLLVIISFPPLSSSYGFHLEYYVCKQLLFILVYCYFWCVLLRKSEQISPLPVAIRFLLVLIRHMKSSWDSNHKPS